MVPAQTTVSLIKAWQFLCTSGAHLAWSQLLASKSCDAGFEHLLLLATTPNLVENTIIKPAITAALKAKVITPKSDVVLLANTKHLPNISLNFAGPVSLTKTDYCFDIGGYKDARFFMDGSCSLAHNDDYLVPAWLVPTVSCENAAMFIVQDFVLK